MKDCFLKIFLILFFGLGFVQAESSPNVVINEIAWMGTSASSYDEWIELYNFSGEEVDLTGWRLISDDGSPNISLAGVIGPRDFFVLERTDDTTLFSLADQIYTGSLSNSGEFLTLTNADDAIVDQSPAGDWSAGDNSVKQSMERIAAWEDGKFVTNWQTSSHISSVLDADNNPVLGSPRTYNSVSPPPPALIRDFVPGEFLVEFVTVAPTTLGSNQEWFSFKIKSETAVDITDWTIRRGTSSKKLTSSICFTDPCPSTSLRFNRDHFPHGNLAGKQLDNVQYPGDRFIFLPPDGSGVFYFTKSPVSLTDSGGTLEILDGADRVLTSLAYPKTKKGTRGGKKYAELWHQAQNEIVPLLFWEDDDIDQIRSSLEIDMPTLPEEISIKISEVALEGVDKRDFIELFVSLAPSNGANIRGLQVTQNGTEVLRIDQDYQVKTGDWLLVYFGSLPVDRFADSIHIFAGKGKQGLANANGTLAVRLWSGTSREEIADFWCWQKDKMSSAMESRITKSEVLGTDECFSLPSITKDESLALDQSNMLFRHYLGSPGNRNYRENPLNQKPSAIIQVQSITSDAINVSGDDSYDPNGDHDLRDFLWEYKWLRSGQRDEWQFLAQKQNPAAFEFVEVQEFDEVQCANSKLKIRLSVADYGGMRNVTDKKFPLTWEDESCRLLPLGEMIRYRSAPMKTRETMADTAETTDFFEEYKELFVILPRSGVDIDLEPVERPKLMTMRDKFYDRYPITPERLQKNIGWVALMND